MCLGNDDFFKVNTVGIIMKSIFNRRRNVKIKEDILKGDYFEFCVYLSCAEDRK